MTTPDVLYVTLIAILSVADHFVIWPAFLRRSQANPGRARLWLWSVWMILLWTMVAAGVGLWLSEARAWTSLRFVAPSGWRMWVAIALVLAATYAHAQPAVRIARSPRPKRVRMAGPDVGKLVPRTATELGWWVALSLSAGFCEEFVYRGYLIWVFQPLLGLWGAAALSAVAFALAHAYQGAQGILSTGIVGILLTLVVLVLGSLWPAIVVHALIDIGQGVISWLVMRQAEGSGDPVTA